MSDSSPGKKSGGRTWKLLLLLALVAIVYMLFNNRPAKETSWRDFRSNMLLQHDVEKLVVVNRESVEVYIRKDSLRKKRYSDLRDMQKAVSGPHYFFQIGSPEIFERRMDEAEAGFAEADHVAVSYTSRSGWLSIVAVWFFPLLILIATYFLLRRSARPTGTGGPSVFDFGKTRNAEYNRGKGAISAITFRDVAGYDEAKTEVMEVVDFLKNSGNFTRLGAKIPKGILLIGPPGSGKTLMAKAVAGEAAVPFFSFSGSEFIEIFVGVGASRVRDLFEKAKEKAPSIVFIDEIDTIGRIRGKAQSLQANDERDSTLNQLLTEMDGFDSSTGVIVLAATNRADILDPALLRAGRFDRHIVLELPNVKEREAIFNVHLRPLKLSPSVGAGLLAAQTPGFSGADIANVCNEAALIASRDKKECVDREDFFNAIDRVVAGLEKKTKIISPGERKVIAYHEAGHVVASWLLPNVDPIIKVSIIPRGKSLGSAWYLPEEHQIVTLAQFSDQMCAALGGRVAEEIVFGQPSSGALDDLEKVTRQAYMMVANLGLDPVLGSISYYDSTGSSEGSLHKPYSEATGRLIDEEVRRIIGEAHKKTTELLAARRVQLDALAIMLLEKEMVHREEIEQVLGKRVGSAFV